MAAEEAVGDVHFFFMLWPEPGFTLDYVGCYVETEKTNQLIVLLYGYYIDNSNITFCTCFKKYIWFKTVYQVILLPILDYSYSIAQ